MRPNQESQPVGHKAFLRGALAAGAVFAAVAFPRSNEASQYQPPTGQTPTSASEFVPIKELPVTAPFDIVPVDIENGAKPGGENMVQVGLGIKNPSIKPLTYADIQGVFNQDMPITLVQPNGDRILVRGLRDAVKLGSIPPERPIVPGNFTIRGVATLGKLGPDYPLTTTPLRVTAINPENDPAVKIEINGFSAINLKQQPMATDKPPTEISDEHFLELGESITSTDQKLKVTVKDLSLDQERPVQVVRGPVYPINEKDVKGNLGKMGEVINNRLSVTVESLDTENPVHASVRFTFIDQSGHLYGINPSNKPQLGVDEMGIEEDLDPTRNTVDANPGLRDFTNSENRQAYLSLPKGVRKGWLFVTGNGGIQGVYVLNVPQLDESRAVSQAPLHPPLPDR